MTIDRNFFEALAHASCQPILGTDRVLLSLSAETSDFVRFNRARLRQLTHVAQCEARLSVVAGQRRADATVTLSGQPDTDRDCLLAWRRRLVELLPRVPADPHLRLPEAICNTARDDLADAAPIDRVVDQILAEADGHDFVGFYAAGPVVRAFADSRGQRNWHRIASFSLDWSLHLNGAQTAAPGSAADGDAVPRRLDRAVKLHYAASHWQADVFRARMAEARNHVERLARPALALPPGAYRTWLAPDAVADLLGTLAWSGFSARDRNTGTSSLSSLVDGSRSLAPEVGLVEDRASGIAPDFTEDGDVTPSCVPLIVAGRNAAALVSPRSAAEFGLTANAGPAEHPVATRLAAGSLASDEASLLAAIDDGLWVSNLWYLNYSDRRACRMTGMTRFACFRVRNGQIVAPIEPMRFDDSFLRMFGPALLGLGAESRFIPGTETWGRRQLQSVHTPGALLADLQFSL